MKKGLISCFWITICFTVLFGVVLVKEITLKGITSTFIISAMYSYVLGMGQGLLNFYLNKKWNWVTQTNQRVGWGIFLTITITVLSVIICNYIRFQIIQNEIPSRNQMIQLSMFIIVLSFGISSFLHAKSFMIEWKKLNEKEIKTQKIIANAAKAQFESLKNQIDPHFLFNSLNVLHSLIEENPLQAQNFTQKISKIYRYVLDQKEKEMVLLSEELNFAKDYCDLLKTRFENGVFFEFNIDDEHFNKLVAPLSLQLLLENCIKHNIISQEKSLVVTIYTRKNHLVIENNLQKRNIPNQKPGIGLQNIIKRYELLTDNKVSVIETPESFKVEMPLLTKYKLL